MLLSQGVEAFDLPVVQQNILYLVLQDIVDVHKMSALSRLLYNI